MTIENWSEIDKKSHSYFGDIIQSIQNNTDVQKNKIAFILVDHCLHTFPSHYESLSELGRVAAVILKSSTPSRAAQRYAEDTGNLLRVSKEQLKNDPSVAKNIILDCTKKDERVVILDHGGYFAPCINDLLDDYKCSRRIFGVVEVTENGHQKYEEFLKRPVRLLSIARSRIKTIEDEQVGRSICDASNALVYRVHGSLDSMKKVCVIGYGKIGRSIANHCRQRGLNVTVLERDLFRMQEARSIGHKVVRGEDSEGRERALSEAQVIFSATGSRALTGQDVAHLLKSSGVTFIASCTSPDDEFSMDFLEKLEGLATNHSSERDRNQSEYHITPYKFQGGREINLLDGGKAVNFALGGTPGYEICQVWAAILFCIGELASSSIERQPSVQTLSNQKEREIAEITCKHYPPEPVGDHFQQRRDSKKANRYCCQFFPQVKRQMGALPSQTAYAARWMQSKCCDGGSASRLTGHRGTR